MKKLFFVMLFAILVCCGFAEIIYIPADQPTIQAGISAAVNGDVVIVSPGTYIENIDFSGKAIVVSSLYLTTQDTIYISQTIIDGNGNNHVVSFISGENDNSVLMGFTITNGFAERGGGIYCANNSNPNISHLIITNNDCINRGGGVYCEESSPNIEEVLIVNNNSGAYAGGITCAGSNMNLINSRITNNTGLFGGGCSISWNSTCTFTNVKIDNNVASFRGGGINCHGSSPNFINVEISNNIALESGGGIFCQVYSDLTLESVIIKNNVTNDYGGGILSSISNLNLSNVTISGNTANLYGGGLCIDSNSTVAFDPNDRCNIYLNSCGIGRDIYSIEILNVIVDTFTVMFPNSIHVSPLENFTFDILNGLLEQVDADLYVSPQGNNSNSGLTVNEPLKTIYYASSIILADSLNPHSIFLADGVYSNSSNEEHFPINLPSYISMLGNSEENVILDAEELTNVFSLVSCSNISLINLTLICGFAEYGGGIFISDCNAELENITLSGNAVDESGGGIYINHSDVQLSGVNCIYNRSEHHGGGLYCESNSNVIIENSSFNQNVNFGSGAGIYCCESNLTLVDVELQLNSSQSGGAIFLYDSNSSMTNVAILNNTAESCGGGIYNSALSLNLSNVTISGNTAGYLGGGIFGASQNMIFDPINRCNIYLNNVENRSLGSDLYSYELVNVIVDTFTVLNPTDFHASLLEQFTFDILNSKQSQSNSDLFVSPDGDNNNSGLSFAEPLKTIQYATSIILADSLNPKSIYLSDGIYSNTINGEFFPISLPNYVSLIGESKEGTILDAEEYASVVILEHSYGTCIQKLTLQNGNGEVGGGIYTFMADVFMSDLIIKNNTAFNGGGVYCGWYSDLSIVNVEIIDNSAYSGGGIWLGHMENSLIIDVLLAGNTSEDGGGAIVCSDSNPYLINTTITNNEVLYPTYQGGGAILCDYGTPSLINCVLWNNFPQEIYFADGVFSNSIYIDHSDVEGGEAGIVTNSNGTVNWQNTNISENPQFINSGDYPFALDFNSPCVDAGTTTLPVGIELPEFDLAGNLRIYGNEIDMGAYEWVETQITNDQLALSDFHLSNYPNPFNPSTTISLDVSNKQNEQIELVIYNLKGQKVKQLIINQLSAGQHSVVWNGDDDSGKPVSSGVYFYKLKVGDFEKTNKMLMMK